MIDHPRVSMLVGRLLRSATEDLSSEAMLGMICTAAIDLLSLDGAGVMVTTADHNRFAFAISEAARELEKIQETMRFGPCRDAAESGQDVLAADADDLAAWPQFAQVAASFGITAAAALPLMSRGRCWGVLDLYSSAPGPWDDESLQVAHMLADGMTAHLVTTADRQQARLAQVQLTHQSTHDELTGLPNRVLLFDRLSHDLDVATSRGGRTAVLFIDLVDFGHVNDVHGHRSGDHVLRETAQRLSALASPGDTVARLGADTFVVARPGLDPGGADEQSARDLAALVLHHVSRPVELEAATVTVTARVGIGVSGGGLTAEELVDEADNALFDAVSDQVPVGLRSFPAATRRTPHVMHTHLPRALADDALTVQYQPVVEATPPHRVVAAEALMRWRSPEGSVIAAASFVEAATRHGLMPAFGAWLVNDVCRQIRAWDDELGGVTPERIFVNLGARELSDPNLPAMLSAALDRHDLSAKRLGLEIVEEALVHRGIAHRINELRDRGHWIAVDDFGTGHSSLARLTQLDVDVIKIDKSLTALLARDLSYTDFIGAVVTLSRAVGAQVVAEGVETIEQRDALIDLGVDRLQGHLFASAELPHDFAQRLSDPRPALLVRHLLTGRAAIVGPATIGQVLKPWFDSTGEDVLDAISQIQDDLDEHLPTRKLQKYLGIEISQIG